MPRSVAHRGYAYQPALDGLRGLAVLAVLLYHGQVDAAPGGFVGVDVFFVLSGFLITSLLLVEFDGTGRIALRAFWGRRARRLLPALVVLLGIVCAYSVFAALPPERGPLRGDAIASLFYVANWRFIAEGSSYFQQVGPPSPLRHMWSLAIEEQWYLVWPLVTVGLLALGRKHRTLLVWVTAALATASALLMVALFQPGHDPSRVYYGTDTRAQAILIGALLAMVLSTQRWRSALARVARELAGWIGVIVLGVFIATQHSTDHFLFQGGLTIAALAAAAVVMASTSPSATPLRFALSCSPLRWIGKISYGLYLYHWPIFVWLTSARTGLNGNALLALRFGTTFAVAIASYVLVETPIRRGGLSRLHLRDKRRAWIALPAASALIVVMIVGTTTGSESWNAFLAGGSNPTSHQVVPAGTPKGLVFGDSVGFTLEEFGGAGVPTGVDWRLQARIGCGLMPGTPVSDGIQGVPDPTCVDWPDGLRQAINTFNPDLVVVVAGAWEVMDHVVNGQLLRSGSPEFEQLLRHELNLAVAIAQRRGAHVVFLDAPCYGPEPGSFGATDRTDPQRIKVVNDTINSIVAHTPGTDVLHWSRYLCPGGKYTPEIDGVVVRYDGVHFAPDGRHEVWKWLAPRLLTRATAARQARLSPTAPST